MPDTSSNAVYQPLPTTPSSGSSSPAGQFRPQIWDPPLILAQIGAIQSLYYVSSSLFLLGGSYFVEFPVTLKCLFDVNLLHVATATGRFFIALYLINALFLSFSLMVLVRRSKLCLDFVATCYIFHFIFSWIYSAEFPASASWWTVQVMSAVLATVMSEYLCLRVEMEAIPVSQSARVDVWWAERIVNNKCWKELLVYLNQIHFLGCCYCIKTFFICIFYSPYFAKKWQYR